MEARSFVLQWSFCFLDPFGNWWRERREKGSSCVQKEARIPVFLNYSVLSVKDIELGLHYGFPLVPDSWPFRIGIHAERKDSWRHNHSQENLLLYLVLYSYFVWVVYRNISPSVVQRWCSKSFAENETPLFLFFYSEANLISSKTFVHLFIQYLNYAYGRHMDLNSTWLTICW